MWLKMTFFLCLDITIRGDTKFLVRKKGAHKNILPVHYNRKKMSSLLANNFYSKTGFSAAAS